MSKLIKILIVLLSVQIIYAQTPIGKPGILTGKQAAKPENFDKYQYDNLGRYNSSEMSSDLLLNTVSICKKTKDGKYLPEQAVETRDNSKRKYTFSYDIKGRLTSKIIEDNFDGTFRFTYNYDNDGNLLQLLQSVLAADWKNVDRYSFSYDSTGKMLDSYYQLWDNGWNNYQKTTYTYEAEGNIQIKKQLIQYWTNNAWTNSGLWTYKYDINGNNILYHREIWSNNIWEFEQEYSYTYDNNGNNTYKLSAFGSPVTYWSSTCTFNSRNDITEELGQELNNNIWSNSFKRTYLYDANGNLQSMSHSIWNGAQWIDYFRWVYSYDGQGNRITELYENWVSSNNNWVNVSQYKFNFDSNGNAILGESYAFKDNQWAFSTSGLELSYNNRKDFIGFNAQKAEVKYTNLTGVEEGAQIPSHFKLSQNYPNPFNPSTTIEYNVPKRAIVKVSIYDIKGQLVRELLKEEKNAGNYSVVWNARNNEGRTVSSGTYFYQIQAGEFIQFKKMIFIK